MNKNQLLESLKQKPIALLGFGTSGRGAYALAQKMGYEMTVFDEAEMEGTRQVFSLGDAHQHSAMVVSPGVREDHPWLLLAQKAELPILSELDFGGLFLSHGVYAITGSNGKTTTTEFVAHTHNMAGRTAVTLGNNGKSLCAWLAENIESEPQTQLVMEISSFQANRLNYLPINGLIWTNFSENHLDWHGTMENYFEAKWKLVERLQEPLFVCGESVFKAALNYQKALPNFMLAVAQTPTSPYDTLPEGTPFADAPFSENFRLATAFGERIGLPRVLWHSAAYNFTLPQYRMAKCGTLEGVTFYNDAKSTTFASTLAAVRRFERGVIWIGGGKSKGGSLQGFARDLAPFIQSAFLIGGTAQAMASLLEGQGISATVCGDLSLAVKRAYASATPGDTIVFSPGFSSLDQFANFAQRGFFFEKEVFELQQGAQTSTNK